MVKKNLLEQLDRIIGIINQDYNPDGKNLSPIIHSLLDKMFITPNKDLVCGIEVTHPKDRKVLPGQNEYKTYKVNIFFVGGPKSKYYPKTLKNSMKYEELMDEAHDIILNMMGIFVDVYSTDVSSCESYEKMKNR